MSRVDKATSERNTKTLRELVKRPENKVCADCKRNDPRWASWNLGVFVCIRCSGIHRSMGTHISKVKSVDLDMWTPEQMASVQKWGNRRANLYWEAHLKAGHVPPDHKIESFIRSKYESRRWAMEGPPPSDPSVLESGHQAEPEAALPATPASPPAPARAPAQAQARAPLPPAPTSPTQRNLLSSAHVQHQRAATAPAPAPAPAPARAEDSLWTLDFNAPPAATAPKPQAAQPDMKNNIMSLFAQAPAAAPAAPAAFAGGFGAAPAGGFGAAPSNGFGAFNSAPAAPPQQQQSFMGQGGGGLWGGPSVAPAPAPAANVWGSPAPAPAASHGAFGADIWGQPQGAAAGNGGLFETPFASQPTAKKDDAFGDLWSSFK